MYMKLIVKRIKDLQMNKLSLIILLLLMPVMVLASSGSDDFPISVAIGMEAFVSLHMSIFVLKPLSEIFAKDNSKKVFWIFFAIRALVLLICDFFITPFIAVVDFIAVFVGTFLVVPISAAVKKVNNNGRSNPVIETPITTSSTSTQNQVVKGAELKCIKCNTVLQITDKVCPNCGEPFDGNNVVVSRNTNEAVQVPPKIAVLPSNFDKIYSLSEDEMLEKFINEELIKAGINQTSKLIPSDILKKKKVLSIIFSILVFVYISLIFIHFPIYTYIIGAILLFIFFKVTRNYNLIKYLKKLLKARPGEKISNIVMNVKNTFINDNTKGIFALSLLISIILPLIIFSSPRILYEKVDDGYAVRYYIFGLTNFKTATIPQTYKNEKVISLRGNTFSNMPFLESVILPDSIIEIRGQAFKNCIKLSEVNIPKNLEYLGGGAFYNVKSIKSIELPDSLVYLGGESFYGAKSLEYVKLSNNLSEIRGDSFEYCTSLKSITIPDNVTRIGGHAFYGDSSLSEVSISENSKLTEIGSSAFRQCSSLYNIIIPQETYVNERAFKESPTSINRFSSSSLGDRDNNESDSNNVTYNQSDINTFNNHSDISLNETVHFLANKFKVILTELKDDGTNSSGNLYINTQRKSGNYSFNTKNNDVINIDGIILKIYRGTPIKEGQAPYINIKVYSSSEFNENYKYDAEDYYSINSATSYCSDKYPSCVSIVLKNILENNGTFSYQFELKGDIDKTFTINFEDYSLIKISDNFAIRPVAFNSLNGIGESTKSISLKVYYN